MKTRIQLFSLLFVSSLSIFVFGQADSIVHADTFTAEMQVTVDKDTFLDPEFLDLDIVISGEENSFNAALADLRYDPNFIEIESITLDKDFCLFSVPELPSTEAGRETIICGTPYNNSASSTTMANIRFRKLGYGWTTLSLSGSSVLAADGLGTEMLSTSETHQIYIENTNII
jgi:hypothetical protein